MATTKSLRTTYIHTELSVLLQLSSGEDVLLIREG